MEVTTAVRKRLLAIPALVGYTTSGRVYTTRLHDAVDGTGHRAVVVSLVPGGWARPQQRNTQEYPIVRLTYWADHDRSGGKIVTANGRANAMAMHRVVDPVIHGIRDEWWGGTEEEPTTGLLIIGCSRWTEPAPAGDGALATGRPTPGDGDSFEAQAVQVDYALQIIH